MPDLSDQYVLSIDGRKPVPDWAAILGLHFNSYSYTYDLPRTINDDRDDPRPVQAAGADLVLNPRIIIVTLPEAVAAAIRSHYGDLRVERLIAFGYESQLDTMPVPTRTKAKKAS